MFVSEVVPQEGWLTAGDPGDFPLPLEPDTCCCGCPEPGPATEPSTTVGPWAVPGVPLPGLRPAPVLTDLVEALDAVQAHGAVSGSRADTALLLGQAERARGLALRELAEMDAVGGHLVEGEHRTTTATWLRDALHLTDGTARSAVRLATELRDVLPELGALLTSGDITVEHASAVLGGTRGLDTSVLVAASGGLCALARVADPTSVRRRLRDLASAVDDRLAAEVERKARDRAGLRISEVGGHTAVDGTLAGEAGATVRLAMTLAIEAARADGDTRGMSARRADVLEQWAADYLQRAHGPGDSLASDAHTVRSHLLVSCTPEQLARTGRAEQAGAPATLADLLGRGAGEATPVSPRVVGDQAPLSRGALRRLACDATVDLVVRLDPAAHECARGPADGVCGHLADPLYVGRSARTISGRQFRALVARDRTCVVKGCHRPPAACAGHHVRHWADGGATDLDNLVLLCHQHHHDHHDRGLDLPHRDDVRWMTQAGWAHAPT